MFSSFSHRSDSTLSSFQINELITELHVFLERFSKLKQIELHLELTDGLNAIYSEPSLLHHILYRLFVLCQDRMSTGQRMVVVTEQDGENVEITFRLIGNPQIDTANMFDGNLMAAVEKLKGTLNVRPKGEEYLDVTLNISSLLINE